jgi:hypothetical protein
MKSSGLPAAVSTTMPSRTTSVVAWAPKPLARTSVRAGRPMKL